MDKIIELNGKGESRNYLQQLTPVKEGVESKTYMVKASCGVIPEYELDNTRYVNIVDGPNIRIGDDIKENIVKYIDFMPGIGCIITFE